MFLAEGVCDLALLRKMAAEKRIKNAEGSKAKQDLDHATDPDGETAASPASSAESTEGSEGLE